MKLIIASLALVAVCVALEEPIPILKLSNEGVNPDGSYQWNFESGNGIVQQEQGVLKNAGSEHAAEEVSGSVQYTADDGTPISWSYIANEHGYQPQGDILPTPHPIPAAIQRALEWIAAHPQPEEKFIVKH